MSERRVMLIYAHFPPVCLLALENPTGMQTATLFGVSISEKLRFFGSYFHMTTVTLHALIGISMLC